MTVALDHQVSSAAQGLGSDFQNVYCLSLGFLNRRLCEYSEASYFHGNSLPLLLVLQVLNELDEINPTSDDGKSKIVKFSKNNKVGKLEKQTAL